MGIIRDFKEETVIVMCENVDGDPGTFWGSDGVGDWFHDILHWGRPNLYDKAGETKKYFKFVLEQNDIYAEKLRSILNNVWECEEYYNTQFSDVSDQLAEYNRMIETLVGQIESKDFIVTFNKVVALLAVLGVNPEDYQEIIDFLRSKGATEVDKIRTIGDLAQLLEDAEKWNSEHPDEQITLPYIPQAALDAIEAHRESAKSGVDLDENDGVNDYKQGNWADEFGYGFAKSACYATCLLIIAQYFGYNITMQDLIDAGCVRASDGYVYKSEPFFTRRSAYRGASPSEYGPAIKEQLARGYPVIISMQGNNSHYVVAYAVKGDGTSNDQIWVTDPATGTTMTLAQSLARGYSYTGVQFCTPCN